MDGGVRSHFAGGRHMREQRSVEKRGRGAGKSTFFYFILKWSLELCRIRWKINFNLKISMRNVVHPIKQKRAV